MQNAPDPRDGLALRVRSATPRIDNHEEGLDASKRPR